MNCPYCGKPALWTSNEVIYGQKYGKSYMCYWCKDCNAYVGCHENTKRALGTMANAELREWRKKVHKALDPLWQSKEMTRDGVYRFLQMHFKRPIHVGQSDEKQCQDILALVAKIARAGV